MDKYAYIKSLKNKKIIIGNGFDLQCGLKSKYSDFFERNEKSNELLHNEIKIIKNKIENTLLNLTKNEILNLFSNKNRKETNIWDLLFHLIYLKNYKMKNKEWNDIETTIEESLLKYESTLNISWYNVWAEYNREYNLLELDTNLLILLCVMNIKYGCNISQAVDFFNILYKELKEFENMFAEYLSKHYINNINRYNFSVCAKDLLKRMHCDSEFVSIESFNYFTKEYYGINKSLKNINGTISNPIFGIDSGLITPSSYNYIFTKTNRRLETDISSNKLDNNLNFENLIIYGHSLNKADYNYFFPLFDKLDLVNNNASGKIIFEYSVYGTRTEYDVSMELKQKIYKILRSYAEYKGIKEYQRFIDFLISDQRIITYQV